MTSQKLSAGVVTTPQNRKIFWDHRRKIFLSPNIGSCANDVRFHGGGLEKILKFFFFSNFLFGWSCEHFFCYLYREKKFWKKIQCKTRIKGKISEMMFFDVISG
jgi:hypothetical protein